MNVLLNRLNELLKVRSVVTIVLLVLVFILGITDRVSTEIITSMFGTVLGFYFGSKSEVKTEK